LLAAQPEQIKRRVEKMKKGTICRLLVDTEKIKSPYITDTGKYITVYDQVKDIAWEEGKQAVLSALKPLKIVYSLMLK
jgi:hypothetical protein